MLLFADPNPGIRYGKVQPDHIVLSADQRHLNADAAGTGELEGILSQVDQYLPQAQRITF